MSAESAEEFRDSERAAWDSVAHAWRRWWRTFEDAAQPLNDQLVELAGVQADHRVLDVATGLGEPALTAARRATRGFVAATDLAPQMLALAVERAREAGLADRVEVVECDAHELPFPHASFDAALSRWGLMLMHDPVAVARAVRERLRPGARFAAAVWAGRERVPFLALPGAVLLETLGGPPPDPDAPGPFRLSRPEALRAVLAGAGFGDVRIVETTVTMRFDRPADYARFVLELSNSAQKQLRDATPEIRSLVESRLEQAAAHYAGDTGVSFDNRVLCAVAARAG